MAKTKVYPIVKRSDVPDILEVREVQAPIVPVKAVGCPKCGDPLTVKVYPSGPSISVCKACRKVVSVG